MTFGWMMIESFISSQRAEGAMTRTVFPCRTLSATMIRETSTGEPRLKRPLMFLRSVPRYKNLDLPMLALCAVSCGEPAQTWDHLFPLVKSREFSGSCCSRRHAIPARRK